MASIRAAIVGGTGYTGVELVRLLLGHPEVSLQAVTSRGEAGIALSAFFPGLAGFTDLVFSEPDVGQLAENDVVFFATPSGVAMRMAPALLERGVRVIDLSADFRLRDAGEWAQWYGEEHVCPEWLGRTVYGLPEVYRGRLPDAQLVANPGCYPTAVQLGFLPLLSSGVVALSDLLADAKSGVSGAGRNQRQDLSFCEATESVRAYGASGHRHWPEINQGLRDAAGRADVVLTFVPHLMPMIRGIHATLYATLQKTDEDVQVLFEQFFSDEPFVDVMPAGSHPETRSVRGANTCRIAVHRATGSGRVVVLSVVDNLVKGAAGQAVQNMNLMFGCAETAGLQSIPPTP